ncbi:MAG TPA: hypothetical protein VJR29_04850 [bacterium]|nr:hypothetical protein [bacterium]
MKNSTRPSPNPGLTRRLSVGWLCLLGLGYFGGVACSSSSTGQSSQDLSALAVLEILDCPAAPLLAGEERKIQVEGRDAEGRVVSVDSLQLQSDKPRYLETKADGSVKALYPGKVSLSASSEGIQSPSCELTIAPPENSGAIRRLSENTESDDWGMNNNWKMTAEGLVLWQHVTAGGDVEILLHDREDDLNVVTPIETIAFGDGEVDFMALGSGQAEGQILASYRVDLNETKISDDGAAPQSLGDQQQEENSIAEGCFFFREGGGLNDIQKFTVGGGLDEIVSAGQTFGPITSQCRAVWETQGLTDSELTYFDGSSTQPVATGLPFFPQYDFRNGLIVFAQDGDIFVADTRAANPAVVPLTQDGISALDEFPKTDGETVIWRRTEGIAQRVMSFEIASGKRQTISITDEPKAADSLQIDLKQAAWIECSTLPCNSANASLWFHNGSGDSSGTDEVDTGLVPLEPGFKAYLMDGLLAWIGNDGDTEVFFME